MDTTMEFGKLVSRGRRRRLAVRGRSFRSVVFTGAGAATHVLLSLQEYQKLAVAPETGKTPILPKPQSSDPSTSVYEVLCRRDAYADYVAWVEAESAEDAAELARESHESYAWRSTGTAEFDACGYVTLDDNGVEIDGTEAGDF